MANFSELIRPNVAGVIGGIHCHHLGGAFRTILVAQYESRKSYARPIAERLVSRHGFASMEGSRCDLAIWLTSPIPEFK